MQTSVSGVRNVYCGNGYTARLSERHLETINVLWADGHVKTMKLDTLMKAGTGLAGTNPLLKYFTNADD